MQPIYGIYGIWTQWLIWVKCVWIFYWVFEETILVPHGENISSLIAYRKIIKTIVVYQLTPLTLTTGEKEVLEGSVGKVQDRNWSFTFVSLASVLFNIHYKQLCTIIS